jgi:hypothetical protein
LHHKTESETHHKEGLRFPTPEEMVRNSENMTLSSFVNVSKKLQTMITAHIKKNPELEKAVSTFTGEVLQKVISLYQPIMNSMQAIKMQEFFIDFEVMQSAQAILFSFGQVLNTLQQETDKPLGLEATNKLKDIGKSLIQHTTAIVLKANEHIEKSEKKDPQTEPKVKA